MHVAGITSEKDPPTEAVRLGDALPDRIVREPLDVAPFDLEGVENA